MIEESIIQNIEKNDKSFLIELLDLEIVKISKIVNKYLEFEEVKRYLSLSATISIIEREKFDQQEQKEFYKQKQQEILEKYQEVKKFVEARKTLTDYKRYKDKLKNYIVSEEGKIYNNIEDNKIKEYKLEDVIKYLFVIKNSVTITEEELKSYRNIVLENLRTFKSFSDDEIKEIFLGTKIYVNPNSYFIEEFKTMESLQTEKYYFDSLNNTINLINPIVIDDENLAEREKNAFYNKKAYELFNQDKKAKTLQKR